MLRLHNSKSETELPLFLERWWCKFQTPFILKVDTGRYLPTFLLFWLTMSCKKLNQHCHGWVSQLSKSSKTKFFVLFCFFHFFLGKITSPFCYLQCWLIGNRLSKLDFRKFTILFDSNLSYWITRTQTYIQIQWMYLCSM